jgi:hypothetical protein
MSKVIIKGVEMPNSCKDCKFCYLGHYKENNDGGGSFSVFGCLAAVQFFYDGQYDDDTPSLAVRQDFCPLE